MDLQEIQLTETDFNMLIDGLDALPEKGAAGLMLADLVGNMIAGNDPRMRATVEKEMGKHEAERAKKKAQLSEEIALLKSKVIMLKRFLITNGALKTTNKILGNE